MHGNGNHKLLVAVETLMGTILVMKSGMFAVHFGNHVGAVQQQVAALHQEITTHWQQVSQLHDAVHEQSGKVKMQDLRMDDSSKSFGDRTVGKLELSKVGLKSSNCYKGQVDAG